MTKNNNRSRNRAGVHWENRVQVPSSCRVGTGFRLAASKFELGEDVIIEDGVTLVGDEVVLGQGTHIGRGSDLRASSLLIGGNSEIGAGVRVLVAESFRVGLASRLSQGVDITCREFSAGGLFYMGDDTSVGYGGTTTSSARVRIGSHVTIGQHSILNANLPIEIGDNVGTGSYLALWTHGYHFGHGPLEGFQPSYAPIQVQENVWLGYRVTLLAGVSVGKNTVLAAGSVVTSDLPANVLAAGVPAVVKKSLSQESISGVEAHALVVNVLRVWLGELKWKGCSILSSDLHEAEPCELTVALPDGSYRTRVVLVRPGQPLPEPHEGSERLVILTVESRSDASAAVNLATSVFQIRSGVLLGPTTPVVEDLRNQLRRYAMPCGDDHCFSSIEPQPFARLRNAAVRPAHDTSSRSGNTCDPG